MLHPHALGFNFQGKEFEEEREILTLLVPFCGGVSPLIVLFQLLELTQPILQSFQTPKFGWYVVGCGFINGH